MTLCMHTDQQYKCGGDGASNAPALGTNYEKAPESSFHKSLPQQAQPCVQKHIWVGEEQTGYQTQLPGSPCHRAAAVQVDAVTVAASVVGAIPSAFGVQRAQEGKTSLPLTLLLKRVGIPRSSPPCLNW